MVEIHQVMDSSSSDGLTIKHHFEKVLIALVEHYRQSIHHEVESDSLTQVPYFDELLGKPVNVPPIINHWKEELLSSHSGENWRQVIQCFVEGYVTIVRPATITNKELPGMIPILKHYELLLSQCWKETTLGPPTNNVLGTEFKRSIHALSHDITLLTAAQTQEKESKKERESICNTVIPTLMHILSHGIRLFQGTPEAVADSQMTKSLALVATTLLAFGTPRLSPRDISSHLPGTHDSILRHCAYPPTEFRHEEIRLIHEDYWNKVQLDGTMWDDAVSGVASRAALCCWNMIDSCVGNSELLDNVSVRKRVCHYLGMETAATAVRAHFFGRDDFGGGPAKQTESSTVAKPSFPFASKGPEMPSHPPFVQVPSRIHVALNFVALLSKSNISSPVLADVLPMCYSLLDSSNSVHVAMGAAALVHLVHEGASETLSEFNEGIASVLELGCRSCRDGPPLTLVCRARSMLLEKCSLGTTNKERRQATCQILTIVQKHSYREMDTQDQLILGLLVGGIVPLLNQHAMEPNADSLEMGKLGLACLLPLLRWDYNVHGTRVQLAVLIALTNLMMGAYPTMPFHGGKIMSELLATMENARQHVAEASSRNQSVQEEELLLHQAVIDLSRHVAAVAVVLCGERATCVLTRVENETTYGGNLIKSCQEIREVATSFRE